MRVYTSDELTITMGTVTSSHNQLSSATLAGALPMLSLPVEGTFDVDENVNIVSARVTVKNGANVLWQGDATVDCCAATGTDYRETGSYAVVAQFTPPASNATLTVQVEFEALRDAQEPSGYETVSTIPVDYLADSDTLYFYDDRLNLIRKVVGDYPIGTYLEWNYEYDALNRMIAAELPDSSTKEWKYDVGNRRLSDQSECHIYTKGWETIADTDNSLSPKIVYILGGIGIDGQLGFVKKEGTAWKTYYYLRDHLSSVLALVDETGVIVESYEYEPYGLPTFYDSVGSLIASSLYENRMLYTGREWDANLEIYQYRNRTYDPRSKRFMQGDPIGLRGGWNYYAYVGGNPINYRDKYGLLAGEQCAQDAQNYYLAIINNPNTGPYSRAGAYVGGCFATLWTKENSKKTAITLATAGIAAPYAATCGTVGAISGGTAAGVAASGARAIGAISAGSEGAFDRSKTPGSNKDIIDAFVGDFCGSALGMVLADEGGDLGSRSGLYSNVAQALINGDHVGKAATNGVLGGLFGAIGDNSASSGSGFGEGSVIADDLWDSIGWSAGTQVIAPNFTSIIWDFIDENKRPKVDD